MQHRYLEWMLEGIERYTEVEACCISVRVRPDLSAPALELDVAWHIPFLSG